MTTTNMSAESTIPANMRRRGLHTALWAIQILLAVFFVLAALPKLAGRHAAVESFAKIGLGQWFRYFIAACELAGAIGLIIPRLSGVAATALVGLMIGATITNLFVTSPATAPLTIMLGLVFVFIAWQRRAETKALVHMLKR